MLVRYGRLHRTVVHAFSRRAVVHTRKVVQDPAMRFEERRYDLGQKCYLFLEYLILVVC